jgi:GNAT superfamily N-acetyltransferase
METGPIAPAHFDTYLALVESALQPAGAATTARQDRPVLLSPANADQSLGIIRDGKLIAGLAYVVRQYVTSCGRIPVAAVGGVVTHPLYRGQGLSRMLQERLVADLARRNIPLAVLWSDQPSVYAGRGFRAAGWEFHLELAATGDGQETPAGFSIREFVPTDTEAVAALYRGHPLRTERLPDDFREHYGMPGTRGLVAAAADGQAAAAAFCGRGADFADYVTEWNGPIGLVLPLLHRARAKGLARWVLAPPGSDHLVDRLLAGGAGLQVHDGGLWAVVQPEQLSRYLQGAGQGAPAVTDDPAVWLGSVTPAGKIKLGALTVAVWGFDSV